MTVSWCFDQIWYWREYIISNDITILRTESGYLVNKDEADISFEDTFNALKIVGDFLDKTIVKPNNLNFPKTRFNFQNSLKLI